MEHRPPLTLQPAGGPSSGDRPSPTQVASVPTRRGWELRHPHPVTTPSPPCHHPPLPRCVLAPSHACSPLRRCPRCHPSLPSSRTLDPFADAVVGSAVCSRTRLFTLSLGSAFGQCRARANCGTCRHRISVAALLLATSPPPASPLRFSATDYPPPDCPLTPRPRCYPPPRPVWSWLPTSVPSQRPPPPVVLARPHLRRRRRPCMAAVPASRRSRVLSLPLPPPPQRGGGRPVRRRRWLHRVQPAVASAAGQAVTLAAVAAPPAALPRAPPVVLVTHRGDVGGACRRRPLAARRCVQRRALRREGRQPSRRAAAAPGGTRQRRCCLPAGRGQRR